MMERLINGLEARNLSKDPERIEQVREWILADGDIEVVVESDVEAPSLNELEQRLLSLETKNILNWLNLAKKINPVTIDLPEDLPADHLRVKSRGRRSVADPRIPDSWSNFSTSLSAAEKSKLGVSIGTATRSIASFRRDEGNTGYTQEDVTVGDLRNLDLLQSLIERADSAKLHVSFIAVAFQINEENQAGANNSY